MFLQHGFYLVDSPGILLVQHLVSDISRENMVWGVPSEAGSGNTASVRSTRDAIRNTVATYAISDEQRGKEKGSGQLPMNRSKQGRYG